jgi:hypothetical protein
MPPAADETPASGDEPEAPSPFAPPAATDAAAAPPAVSPWSRDAVLAPSPFPDGAAGGAGPVVPPSPWSPAGASSMPTTDTTPPPIPPPAAPAWSAAAGAAGPTAATPSVEAGEPIAEPGRPRRSKLVVGGAVAAVLAVGGAGVFAVSSFTGSDPGGAATPEELGLDLLTALENEDVLGAVDLLLPGERDVLRQPLVDLVSELTRLEVLSPEADLSKILGYDIELTGERAEPKPTNVDDIVNVALAADATVTFDGAQIPIGDLITDNLTEEQLDELRGTNETDDDVIDLSITAVRQDGRWYFSAFHTIAEAARQAAVPDAAIPAAGLAAEGAESPEAAIDRLFANVEALDVRGLIAGLNPGEASALQRYAPLFLDEVEAEIDQAPLEWRITERDVRIEGSGDTRTAFLDALTVEGTADAPFSFSYDGKCVTAEAEGESVHQCVGDVTSDSVDEVFGEMPAVMHLFDTVTEAFSDYEPAGLELRKTDGEWFVSPTATITEAFLNLLRALDRSELDAIIDAVPPALDEFFGSFWEGGDDFVFEEPAEPFPSDDGSFDGSLIEDTAADGESATGRDWYRCFDESDPDVAAACFDDAVASGEIDDTMVPVVLRFPECGFTQAWYGNHMALTDDEFTALATAAQPCFQALIDSGQAEEWELPDEITHLDCLEGRNLYASFDDPDYTDRAFACINGE